ncbi:sialic acid-binding Ig-like lectin 13 [Chiloscyllium punctatum]|uniref:sialic acid-binding Ig-like lectin 13 n=1 Tax=Chiloscyllium punctatum TaxID=137246 RepID=UPI003B639819
MSCLPRDLIAIPSEIPGISGNQCSVIVPEHVLAVVGGCVEIQCTFDPKINYTYRKAIWIKKGVNAMKPSASVLYDSEHPSRQQNDYSGRVVFTGDFGKKQCSLLLNDIRKTDEGTYQVILVFVSEVNVTEHSEINISVSEKPTISHVGEIIAGQIVRLKCSVSQNCPNGNLQLKWTYHNQSIPLQWDVEVKDESSNSRTVSSVLTLIPSAVNHGTMLKCTITSGSFQISSPETLILQVKYKPVIMAGPICTTSEHWINCTCTSKANPPANMTWATNGRMIPGNSSVGEADTWGERTSSLHLSLMQDHPNQTGDVIACISTNEHGNSTSKYQLPSDGGKSGTIILMVGGITAGLGIFIAIAAIMKLRMKKLEETSFDARMNDDFIIYSSLRLSTNTESDSHALGLQLTETTQNKPIVYAAIRL